MSDQDISQKRNKKLPNRFKDHIMGSSSQSRGNSQSSMVQKETKAPECGEKEQEGSKKQDGVEEVCVVQPSNVSNPVNNSSDESNNVNAFDQVTVK